ncbi:MAG: RND transporter [Gammaproteobacteria bacterium]|nr:MAG: RND transporter [Gammaproteobacteria bacterium]RKZ43735.1 MAG: RND transporter [Gammaproteobacteria bacterium]RKZ72169.1 MAG: RND transporter [Gammaproteobacteria bacterium]
MRWLEKLPWELLILGSLTLGLAPFIPEPHLIEKIRMLLQGTLSRPIDIFDLFMHGAFPVLLLLKIGQKIGKRRNKKDN